MHEEDKNKAYLQIVIDRKDPIPVEDLGLALQSLSEIYDKNTQLHGEGGKAKIYIGRVNDGSIEIEIISKIVDVMANTFGFIKLVKSIRKEIDDVQKLPDESRNRKNDAQIQNLAKTVFGNPSNNITFNVYNNNHIEHRYYLDGKEANEVVEKTNRPVQKITGEEHYEFYEEQIFRWSRAQAGHSRGADRGVISDISHRVAKVIFDDSNIKYRMLKNDPFERGFIVDVEVCFVDSHPKSYRVVELHAAVDKNGEVKRISPRA